MEIIAYTMLGLFALYVAARLVSAAFFNSKKEYYERSRK